MNIKLPISIAALLAISSSLSASITVAFSVGLIRDQLGAQAQLGSIGILVADTTGDGFIGDISSEGAQVANTTLSNGQFIGGSGDDVIIGVMSANDNFAIGTVFDAVLPISYTGNHTVGDAWALYWFPAETSAGSTVTSGNYGFYRSDTFEAAAGADIAFVAPADGFFWNLVAGGTDIGGTVPDAALSATLMIPEPSTYAAIFGAIAVLVGLLRRR